MPKLRPFWDTSTFRFTGISCHDASWACLLVPFAVGLKFSAVAGLIVAGSELGRSPFFEDDDCLVRSNLSSSMIWSPSFVCRLSFDPRSVAQHCPWFYAIRGQVFAAKVMVLAYHFNSLYVLDFAPFVPSPFADQVARVAD